jgi:hypothetical protein
LGQSPRPAARAPGAGRGGRARIRHAKRFAGAAQRRSASHFSAPSRTARWHSPPATRSPPPLRGSSSAAASAS